MVNNYLITVKGVVILKLNFKGVGEEIAGNEQKGFPPPLCLLSLEIIEQA